VLEDMVVQWWWVVIVVEEGEVRNVERAVERDSYVRERGLKGKGAYRL